MFRFLLRVASIALLLALGALTGFMYGRSDQSDNIAMSSVANVCGVADTSLGSYLPQDRVDNAVLKLADLFKLSNEDRAQLSIKAEKAGKSTPCLDALAHLHPRSQRSVRPTSI